jgi:hypothetical protein
VPSTKVTRATTRPTNALFVSALRNSGDSTISRYHRIENPANGNVRLPVELNENSTTRPRGTNRNNRAAIVSAVGIGAR